MNGRPEVTHTSETYDHTNTPITRFGMATITVGAFCRPRPYSTAVLQSSRTVMSYCCSRLLLVTVVMAITVVMPASLLLITVVTVVATAL
jgi:hypothetical protein